MFFDSCGKPWLPYTIWGCFIVGFTTWVEYVWHLQTPSETVKDDDWDYRNPYWRPPSGTLGLVGDLHIFLSIFKGCLVLVTSMRLEKGWTSMSLGLGLYWEPVASRFPACSSLLLHCSTMGPLICGGWELSSSSPCWFSISIGCIFVLLTIL